MKVQIPDDLKADVPKDKWGKMLSTTPVIMAVIATLLAGLASSEMTRAQYDRSLAAQQQSKAGDQWSFFQAKRLRGAVQRGSADVLASVADVRTLEAARLKDAAQRLEAGDAAAKSDLDAALATNGADKALAQLERGEAPRPAAEANVDPTIKAALEAVESQSDDDAPFLAASDSALTAELKAAQQRAQAYDGEVKPISQAIDRIESALGRLAVARAAHDSAEEWQRLKRDTAAARLRFAAQRYDVEAHLNQEIADIYEVQVRRSNLSAERHHRRSQRFFFGMLAAQLGVIISTVALAAKQRNVLWSLGAAAGLAAVAFAGYVYVCV